MSADNWNIDACPDVAAAMAIDPGGVVHVAQDGERAIVCTQVVRTRG